jgi:hypothetical protein
MPEHLRILNQEGRGRWRQWIEDLRRDPKLDVPMGLLSDEETSLSAPITVFVPVGPFGTKFEMARQLLPAILALETSRLPDSLWPGVWDWLALRYFEEICPALEGARKARAVERYCFAGDYRKNHRHRVLGPVAFYRVGLGAAELFLSSEPKTLSDQEEQIGSRQEIAASRALLQAMALLYWKSSEKRPLRGWAPNSPKPGSLRRFVALVGQLSRTYDLQATQPEAILGLLPKEFHPWRDKAKS